MQGEHRSLQRWKWVSWLAALLPLVAGAASAAPNLEDEVKAAFLLNFAKFVDWPPSAFAGPDAPIAICILGKDPFGGAIDELVAGETANGRKLIVRRIDRPPASGACQIVFAGAPGKEAARLLSNLGQGVLTVGEGRDFVRDGGMIGFVIDNRRVRFDINQGAAQAASLKLSAKLLAVARNVLK
jgi:hypothetical protein